LLHAGASGIENAVGGDGERKGNQQRAEWERRVQARGEDKSAKESEHNERFRIGKEGDRIYTKRFKIALTRSKCSPSSDGILSGYSHSSKRNDEGGNLRELSGMRRKASPSRNADGSYLPVN